MHFPVQNLVNLVLLALLSLPILPSAFADEAKTLQGARCGANNSNSYRCQAIRNYFKGASGIPGTCAERITRAEECCKTWMPSSTCTGMMDDAGRRNINELISSAGPVPGGAGADPESVYGTIGKDRVKNEKGRNASESMEGICRATIDSCSEMCTADPEKKKCSDLNSYVQGFRTQASNYQNAIDEGIKNAPKAGADPGNPGGGSGNPGGGSGNPGGGSNAQQPQSKQGGQGNPMADMMKALSGMMNQQGQQQQAQQQPIPPPQDCSANPALAGCPVKAAEGSDSWNKKAGEAEMKEPEEKSNGENFNVASDGATNSAYDGNGEKKFSTPPTVNPVQGGGGGGIPGQGGGGGGAQASAGGAAAYGAAAKNLADVMHGTMSGGYAATNQAMQMQNGGGGGGFSGYGGGNGEGGMRGMDLRQFLPGGKNDPTRKLAGGTGVGSGNGMQIQSQSVNIWNRITERIKSRCSQGLLRDCIP